MNESVEKWIKIYLKCYINLILFYRNVYPATSFDLTNYQAFKLPQHIPINRHIGLQTHIEELVKDLLSKIVHIFKISIGIIDKADDICIERYVLDFGEFQHMNESDILEETDVYNEFRSSLNSLISKLEKLPQIIDDTVTFQVYINTVEYNPHDTIESLEAISNEEDKNEFERATNWTKYNLGEITGHSSYSTEKQRIKMTSLVGCDVGPLVIYSYIEQLLNGIPDNIYKEDSTELKFDDILSSL